MKPKANMRPGGVRYPIGISAARDAFKAEFSLIVIVSYRVVFLKRHDVPLHLKVATAVSNKRKLS